MVVPSFNPPHQILPGNDSAVFTFTFPTYQNGSLRTIDVFVWDGNDTSAPIIQVQGFDYEVSSDASSTRITFINGRFVPSGSFVIGKSVVPLTQEINFPTGASVNPQDLQTAVDRMEMQIKQLGDSVRGTFHMDPALDLPGIAVSTADPNSPTNQQAGSILSSGYSFLVSRPSTDGGLIYVSKAISNPNDRAYIVNFTDFSIDGLQEDMQKLEEVRPMLNQVPALMSQVSAAVGETRDLAAEVRSAVGRVDAYAVMTQNSAVLAANDAAQVAADRLVVEGSAHSVEDIYNTFLGKVGQFADAEDGAVGDVAVVSSVAGGGKGWNFVAANSLVVGADPDRNAPDPVTGFDGALLQVRNNAYVFGTGITLSNVPVGYTLNCDIDLSTMATGDGIYFPAFVRNGANHTITASLINTQQFMEEAMAATTITTRKVVNLSHTTPNILFARNDQAISRYISNETDVEIRVGSLTELTADPLQSIGIGVDYGMRIQVTDELYGIAASSADAVGNVILVEIVPKVP